MRDYEIVEDFSFDDDRIYKIYVRVDLRFRMENILQLLGLPGTYQPEISCFTIRKTILWEENEIDHIKSFIAKAWEKMAENGK